METNLSELKSSIKMLTQTSDLVTLAENVRTESNYLKAQSTVVKLNRTILSQDKKILETRLSNLKKEGSTKYQMIKFKGYTFFAFGSEKQYNVIV